MAILLAPLTITASEETYRQYHTNPGNVAVHAVCIPLLVATVLAALARINVANGITMAHVAAVTHCIPHVSTVDGIITLMWMLLIARYVSNRSWSWRAILSIHATSWILQIVVGHMILEESRPAFMDSLIPSLLIAPLAVTHDVRISSWHFVHNVTSS